MERKGLYEMALAGVVQWAGHRPTKWKVAGSIPRQGTCLGCGPGPQLGAWERQQMHVSLAHWCFSPSFPPSLPHSLSKICSFKFYLFIFRPRVREGERKGEKHQCVVTFCAPHPWDLACNPGMCPDGELNRWPFGLQASTQSTKPHQPGLKSFFFFLRKDHMRWNS